MGADVKLWGALVVGLLATPALAGQICTFDTECLEGEDCQSSAYDLTVIQDNDGSWRLQDIAGEHSATAAGSAWFASMDDGASGAMLLTIADDGRARYSVHMPMAEISILYLGQCQDSG